MNGYTSGKVSHNPEPWLSQFPGLHRFERPPVTEGWRVSHPQTAPEFDNHNPILVAFRFQPDIDLWDMGFAMFTTFGGYKDWEKDHHYFRCFTVATDHQIAHARRVLTKYAAVFL